MSVNRVTLIGYPGGDPEARFLPSGQQVVNFFARHRRVLRRSQRRAAGAC